MALCRGQRPTRRPSYASEVQYMLLQFSLFFFCLFLYSIFLSTFFFSFFHSFCQTFAIFLSLKKKKKIKYILPHSAFFNSLQLPAWLERISLRIRRLSCLFYRVSSSLSSQSGSSYPFSSFLISDF